MTRKQVSLATGVTIAHLLRKTIAEHPPIEHPLTLANTTSKMRLGHYLLSLGYITPQHLVRALAEQRQSIEQGAPLMLGDILVRAQIIPPRVLTTILLVQLVERLLDLHWQPQRLGEQLVAEGMIDLPTLASAIQLQTWLRQAGTIVPLGDLLVQQEKLTQQRLSHALSVQRDRYLEAPLTRSVAVPESDL